MMIDTYGGCHSTTQVAAIKPYEEAVFAVLAHRAGAAEALSDALCADPHLVAAHALRGFGALILARAELHPVAQASATQAQLALTHAPEPTAAERVLVSALKQACHGAFLSAAARLEAHLAQAPGDLLMLKLVQALRFMAGDLPGMLRATHRVLPHWQDDRPGAGFVYGCHAFALEEAGDFEAAERLGRHGLMLEPTDAWGLHAVSHVHEMQGRLKEGVQWLESSRRTWSRCNNFAFHIAWHLALFHLEHGDGERALALYDADVRPHPTDDFRDISNACSLLWRLQQHGLAVGPRWAELAALAKVRATDTSLVFASLFHLMGALQAQDRDTAEQIVAAWEAASMGAGDQARVAHNIGLPLARILVQSHHTQPQKPLSSTHTVDHLLRNLPDIGGSHAQRDVFVRTLALMAAEAGDPTTTATILHARGRLRAEGRFADLARQRLALALNSNSTHHAA